MDVRIEGVRVAGTPTGPVPVVLLAPDGVDGTDGGASTDGPDGTDETGETGEVLPIFIGFDEATSIARGMEAQDVGRPLTHDLLLDVVEELGGRVTRVVVSDIDDGTYIADLHLRTPRGETVVDARPSDSLALAARTGADVEVAESVFEEGRADRAEFAEMEDIREVAER